MNYVAVILSLHQPVWLYKAVTLSDHPRFSLSAAIPTRLLEAPPPSPNGNGLYGKENDAPVLFARRQ
jgi:hypothetical protein